LAAPAAPPAAAAGAAALLTSAALLPASAGSLVADDGCHDRPRTGVYVLRLRRGGMYYVGSSSDIDRRICEHQAEGPRSAAAVRHFGGVAAVEVPITSPMEQLGMWELQETLVQMQRHGRDRVRGASFVRCTLGASEAVFLDRMLRDMTSRCYECGSTQHRIANCPSLERASGAAAAATPTSGQAQACDQRRSSHPSPLTPPEPALDRIPCARCGWSNHPMRDCFSRRDVLGNPIATEPPRRPSNVFPNTSLPKFSLPHFRRSSGFLSETRTATRDQGRRPLSQHGAARPPVCAVCNSVGYPASRCPCRQGYWSAAPSPRAAAARRGELQRCSECGRGDHRARYCPFLRPQGGPRGGRGGSSSQAAPPPAGGSWLGSLLSAAATWLLGARHTDLRGEEDEEDEVYAEDEASSEEDDEEDWTEL
jgi:hypothetical protein